MIEGLESTLPAPVVADSPAGWSAWRFAGKLAICIAIVGAGLTIGAISGVIVSLFTGLIEFRC